MKSHLPRRTPIYSLPEGYQEALHLSFEDYDTLMKLNLWAFVLIIPFVALMVIWTAVVKDLRDPLAGAENWPSALLWIGVISVLLLHELVHGVAIQWTGHRPRYGAKVVEVGPIKLPYVLYATADKALFRRVDFCLIALAPVVVITIVGMLLMLILPDRLGFYISAAVVVNGSGAIGDLWMTAVVLRFPSTCLVRDEADGIRVFVAGQ